MSYTQGGCNEIPARTKRQPGRPLGACNKKIIAMEEAVAKHAQEAVEIVMRCARGGDPTCLRLLMDPFPDDPAKLAYILEGEECFPLLIPMAHPSAVQRGRVDRLSAAKASRLGEFR